MKKIKKNIDKITAYLIIILTIIAVIPIIILARYNVPEADDYCYSQETFNAWNTTHNLLETLRTAIEKVKLTYFDWQGTFSAVFLFALQPSIFGMQYYALSTIILILMLFLSIIYFTNAVISKCLNCKNKSIVAIVSLTLTTMSIESLPVPRESLFWWNGSIYYTFFFSIELIVLGLIINLIKKEKETKAGIVLRETAILILSAIISGGNYPVELTFAMMLLIVTIILFIKKRQKKWIMMASFIINMLGFIISMKAPGNLVRQSSCDNSLGVFKTIERSITYAIMYISEWSTLITILTFIFVLPYIYKAIKNTKYEFKYPLLFTVITFGIFSAQFAPPLFAMNNIGGSRLLDIIYYSYYLLIISNLTYYVGWSYKKFGENKLIEYINERQVEFNIIIFIIFIFVIYSSGIYKKLTTVISYKSIESGEAKEYYQEIEERYRTYEDDNIKNVEFNEISVKPEYLYGTDLTKDKENWINIGASLYFKKNYVVIKDEKVNNN